MQRHPRKLEVLGQIEAFLAQRTEKNAEIMEKFARYFALVPTSGLPWTEEALARLERIPPFVRGMVQQAAETQARKQKEKVVTPQLFSQVVEALLSAPQNPQETATRTEASTFPWDPEPLQRLQRIPIAAIRERVRQRVERYCQAQGAK